MEIEGGGHRQVAYGSVWNISCELPEDPTTFRLKWTKGHETVRPEDETALSSVYVKHIENKCVLIFNGTRGADGGEYTCLGEVLNNTDSNIGSKSFSVEITGDFSQHSHTNRVTLFITLFDRSPFQRSFHIRIPNEAVL